MTDEEATLATREWFANNSRKCIEDVVSGQRQVNDLAAYVEWQQHAIEECLAGRCDHTFTFRQRRHFIQTGESISLFAPAERKRMIDWNWPIEWDDGTPAWVGSNADNRVVFSAEQPGNWGRGMPEISHSRGVFVNDSGTFRAPHHVRNVKLPERMKFEDGQLIIGGRFMNDTDILLRHPVSGEHSYSWPTFRPQRGAMKLIIPSTAEAIKAKQIEQEIESMSDNPLFGMF